MKTAKEWMDEFNTGLPYRPVNEDDIKLIQEDAWRQGMQDAANMVTNYLSFFDFENKPK